MYRTSVLIALFTTVSVYGADPCPNCPTVMVLDDVSQGLQTTLPAYKISGSPYMRNVFIDNGKLETVGGFNVIGSTGTLGGITGIFPFVSETGQTSFIVTDSSVALETTNFNSYVTVSTGLNTGTLLRCLQVRNKMWCTNGADPVFTWDRTTKVNLDGTNGTPSVPKFKYPAYWQNRVFGLNTAADGSLLSWSELKSTAGAQIAPDNFLAWPAGAALSIGIGDGQVGSAVWISDGQLNVGKERSIYTIFGTDTSSFRDRKVLPNLGVNSNDSVVVLDGNSYFVGQDGFQSGVNRISDDITPDFRQIQLDTSKTIQNLWDTQSDFAKGQFYGSTATSNGLLTIITVDQSTQPTGLLGAAFSNQNLDRNTTFYTQTLTFNQGIKGFIQKVSANIIGLNDGNLNSPALVRLTVKNLNTNVVAVTTAGIQGASGGGGPSGNLLDFNYRTFGTTWPTVDFQDWEMSRSSLSIKVEYTDQTPPPNQLQTIGIRDITQWIFTLSPGTTGQFISDVATLSVVSAWENLDSLRNTNSGSLNFYSRTSTSVINITTQAWVNQPAGTRINAPTINLFVQWATTVTSVSSFTNTPTIDNVTIGHIEGAGAANRPFATDWKSRPWIATSTETTGKFTRIFVKSRITNRNPNAWMPIEGINIKAFGKDGSNAFYGGDASTGVFYRLDDGTNFNGQPINPVYETPDIFMGDIYDEKELLEYTLFADKETGNILTLGTSINGGTYVDRSVDLDGSGRLIKLIQSVSGKGHYFRFRFKNSQLDKGLRVTNFGVVYNPTKVRKPK